MVIDLAKLVAMRAACPPIPADGTGRRNLSERFLVPPFLVVRHTCTAHGFPMRGCLLTHHYDLHDYGKRQYPAGERGIVRVKLVHLQWRLNGLRTRRQRGR